jgi:hypothetical protein
LEPRMQSTWMVTLAAPAKLSRQWGTISVLSLPSHSRLSPRSVTQ